MAHIFTTKFFSVTGIADRSEVPNALARIALLSDDTRYLWRDDAHSRFARIDHLALRDGVWSGEFVTGDETKRPEAGNPEGARGAAVTDPHTAVLNSTTFALSPDGRLLAANIQAAAGVSALADCISGLGRLGAFEFAAEPAIGTPNERLATLTEQKRITIAIAPDEAGTFSIPTALGNPAVIDALDAYKLELTFIAPPRGSLNQQRSPGFFRRVLERRDDISAFKITGIVPQNEEQVDQVVDMLGGVMIDKRVYAEPITTTLERIDATVRALHAGYAALAP